MSHEPSKAYSPAGVERRIYEQWIERGCFHAVPQDADSAPPFSIVIPPPNVTGALHLGHAINNTLQDILIRRKRMQGYAALWMPGVDHAGIATQAVVEKKLFEDEKKNRHDLGREALVERIWKWKEQYGNRIVEQLKLMGCSCDWQRQRFTLDEVCARAVREWFFRMFRDGLIFRGKRLVNWDTHLQTAVADDEVYHETVKGHLWQIRYPLAGAAGAPRANHRLEAGATTEAHTRAEIGDGAGAAAEPEFLVVATTRPETMLADTAVAVHPDDERYRHLIGRQVVLPLTGRTIPIIADGILVKREFGTGCVKVTPGHDPNDYACYQRNPAIGIRNMMTPDGRVNEENAGEPLPASAGSAGVPPAHRLEAGATNEVGASAHATRGRYAGLKMDAARKKVVEDLEAAGLLHKVEEYQTDVGHSDRSKTPIQPYLSDQWFVRMGDIEPDASQGIEGGVPLGDGTRAAGLAQAAIDALCHDDAHYEGVDAVAARSACAKLHIFPRRYGKTYTDWLSEKRDWCISRQLWWGHRIPVWIKVMPGVGGRSWAHQPPLSELSAPFHQADWGTLDLPHHDLGADDSGETARHAASIHYLCFNGPITAEDRSVLASHGYEQQDPDVLDTWFSSALWPLSTMGWPGQTLDAVADPHRDALPNPNRDHEGATKRPGQQEARPDARNTADSASYPNRDREGVTKHSPSPGARPDARNTRASASDPNRDREGATKRPADQKARNDARTAGSHERRALADPHDQPLAYFITFRTYGTWLHGDARGSVARGADEPGAPLLDPDEQREFDEFHRLKHAAVLLDASARAVVERTIAEVCQHRGWDVHAVNARSNHVHVVVSGDAAPEKMMNDFKSWATWRLNEAGAHSGERTWARHGSTKYLWVEQAVAMACQYVRENQGNDAPPPLAILEGEDRARQARSDASANSKAAWALPHGRGSDKTDSPPPEPGVLQAFFPTDVLSTAREIITLWVARMTIAALYNVGRVPFRDVVIHPVIQDGQGRPMKKSLGNGVDPVDIIDLYGADALRFTLAGMATETQDIRVPVKKSKLPDGREVNTSDKFELGRNFCNKLWQAATGFILPNVADVRIEQHPETGGTPVPPATSGASARSGTPSPSAGAPLSPALSLGGRGSGVRHTRAAAHELPLFDRWIRTRLNACIRDVDAALDAYQFSRAADRVRDFFWTEFCDWYLEESKLRLRPGSPAGTGQHSCSPAAPGRQGDDDGNDVKVVLLQTLDLTLCLLHPFIPFVTEAIWEEIGKRIPRHFELIAAAGWPIPFPPQAERGGDATGDAAEGGRATSATGGMPAAFVRACSDSDAVDSATQTAEGGCATRPAEGGRATSATGGMPAAFVRACSDSDAVDSATQTAEGGCATRPAEGGRATSATGGMPAAFVRACSDSDAVDSATQTAEGGCATRPAEGGRATDTAGGGRATSAEGGRATPLLVQAPWPKVYEPFLDPRCDAEVGGVVQPIMTALRQARTEINTARSKAGSPAIRSLPSAVIKAAPAVCAIIEPNAALIQRLGGLDAVTIAPNAAKPPRVRSHIGDGFELYVPLGDLIDIALEESRLQAELAEKRAALQRADAQLANEGFVNRASPEAVQQTRDRAAELSRQCALIERHLADLA